MLFKHILCPVDFSESSRLAMAKSAELATPETTITLLHVLELPVAYSGEPQITGFIDDLDQRSARQLDEWAASLGKDVKAKIVTETTIGRPAAQVLDVLDRDPSIDLVVIGSHGRTGLGRFLLGS